MQEPTAPSPHLHAKTWSLYAHAKYCRYATRPFSSLQIDAVRGIISTYSSKEYQLNLQGHWISYERYIHYVDKEMAFCVYLENSACRSVLGEYF